MSTTIGLLAPRLRVEERLLTQAFAERGASAELLDASTLALPLEGEFPPFPHIMLDRDLATSDRALLGALLASSGTPVVNRTATTRLLADRLALFRHLAFARIPVPQSVVAMSDKAALSALGQLGYPAVIRTLQAQPEMPDAVVGDSDIADAVLEHRLTLGHATSVLIQKHAVGAQARAAVVGDTVMALESINAEGFSPFEGIADEPLAIAGQVVSRLGTGIYDVRMTQTDAGWLVTDVHNLTDFRSLQSAGHDVAAAVVTFTLSQLEGA